MTRSDQLEPPAVAIVRQNGLSSANSRASVADTPVSRQISWTQVVDAATLNIISTATTQSPPVSILFGVQHYTTEQWPLNALGPKQPGLGTVAACTVANAVSAKKWSFKKKS